MKQKIYRVEQRMIVTNAQYILAHSREEALRKYNERDYDDDLSDTLDNGDTTTSIKVFVAHEEENATALDAFTQYRDETIYGNTRNLEG